MYVNHYECNKVKIANNSQFAHRLASLIEL